MSRVRSRPPQASQPLRGRITKTGVSAIAYDTKTGTNASSAAVTWYDGVNVFATDGSYDGDAVGDDAVELGWSAGGSQGFIQAYDRNASAFRPLILNNSLNVDASGDITSAGQITIDSVLGNPVLKVIANGGGGAAQITLQTTGYTSAIYQYQGSIYHSTTSIRPAADNGASCGGASFRWTTVDAVTGTINTSDAREKTAVAGLTANELEASKLLGKEIGTYKWLASIAEKGEGARTHIGMTVQRAIEIMESCNLDPMAYGFNCYDEWEDDIAVEQPAIEAQDAVLDEDGEVVLPLLRRLMRLTKEHTLAGNRYGYPL
jgi:hypothetical protein